MSPDQNLVLMAAIAIGSSARLAGRLGIPHALLRSWLRGEQQPPPEVVAQVATILESQREWPSEGSVITTGTP
jgi:DNA-binding transcriptional regulator YdaS (Cro superfamily)